MLRDVIEFLVCPHCRSAVFLSGSSVGCPHGHRFDVARQGYVNLLPGDTGTATSDTAAMVAARETFLRAGHFDPILEAVAAEASQVDRQEKPGCVIDLGAGPGVHLAAVLERLPQRVGLALDLSKYALRRAARRHPRMGAIVCDVWRALPVRADAATVILNAFAPRNGDEMLRILRPDGALLVVTPTPRHLQELVSPLGLLTVDPDKQERIRESLEPELVPVRRTGVEYGMTLHHPDVESLVAMGPSAWHVQSGSIRDRLAAIPAPLHATASVTISLYRPV